MPVLYLTEQGAMLRKEGELLKVTKDKQTLQEIWAIKVEQVVILGNISITTPVIHYLLKEGIDCVFCSSYGRYCGRLFSSSSRFGQLRQRQLEATSNPATRLSISCDIVKGKLQNQKTVLLRYLREKHEDILQTAADGIQSCLDKLAKASDVSSVMGLEGQASSLYYKAFKTLLKRDLGFESREKRPPPDPVNSLLSFGYTLLTYNMQCAVHTVGLDPFLGFLHCTEYSRPSLVLDLIEEFRSVIVDSIVLRSLNTGAITMDDFQPPAEQQRGTFLTQEGIKKFIRFYEERVQTSILHPIDKIQTSYRRCFELQARHLSRVILGREADYQPFLVK